MFFLHQQTKLRGGNIRYGLCILNRYYLKNNWDAPHRSPRKTTSQPQCHMFCLLRCHAGALQLYIWSIKPRLNSTLAGQAVHQEFQIINHWFGGFQLGKLWKNGLSSPSLSSLLAPAKKWSLKQIDGKTHPASLGFLSVRVWKQPHVLKKHWQHAPETSTIRLRLNTGNEDLDQHAEIFSNLDVSKWWAPINDPVMFGWKPPDRLGWKTNHTSKVKSFVAHLRDCNIFWPRNPLQLKCPCLG